MQRLVPRLAPYIARGPTAGRLHDTRTATRIRDRAENDTVGHETCVGTVGARGFGDGDAGDGFGGFGGGEIGESLGCFGGCGSVCGCGWGCGWFWAGEEVGFVGGSAGAVAWWG